MSKSTNIPVLETDNLIVKKIKQKLNQSGGSETIPLLQGGPCEIWYSLNGKGLESSKIPLENQLTWDVFTATVELVIEKGGKAVKGNARAGRLGSDRLPLDSVEGNIAHKVRGLQEGDSAYGPGFVVCSILDWAEICKNERGFLSIRPMFLLEFNESH